MAKDYVLSQCNCFCAYVKTDISKPDGNFFSLVHDKDCTKELYRTNYDKPIDDSLKKVAFKYAHLTLGTLIHNILVIVFIMPSGKITYSLQS